VNPECHALEYHNATQQLPQVCGQEQPSEASVEILCIPSLLCNTVLTLFWHRNRALSIRSNKNSGSSTGRHGFSFSSLRGTVQPELSKKLYKLIKSENHLIQSYEAAGKERLSIASQLSDWGEATTDEAISDISDKIGVLLSELGEQEDLYAHNLDDSRAVLKAIRNTEKSVQPSRDNKAKIADEIAKLKTKEPQSAKLVILEQELVRAEAENLVAEAQLTNIVRLNPCGQRPSLTFRIDTPEAEGGIRC
jgi:hypothetical protein